MKGSVHQPLSLAFALLRPSWMMGRVRLKDRPADLAACLAPCAAFDAALEAMVGLVSGIQTLLDAMSCRLKRERRRRMREEIG